MPSVTITSLEGPTFEAYAAFPSGPGGPGLVVLHPQEGITPAIRAACDTFAAEGYMVLCPNLFWRLKAGTPVTDLAFDVEGGARDVLATVAYVRRLPGYAGKTGVVGYGLGGRLAWLAASRSDVEAVVSYEGHGLETLLHEVHDIRMPFLVHIAGRDPAIPPATQARILKKCTLNPVLRPHVLPEAEAGFIGQGTPAYNAALADEAVALTRTFLAEELKDSPTRL